MGQLQNRPVLLLMASPLSSLKKKISFLYLTQVTIDSTNDAHMPQGRYFHAAEISLSRKEIFIHGGLTSAEAEEGTLQNTTLIDFWKFRLKPRHWIEIEVL